MNDEAQALVVAEPRELAPSGLFGETAPVAIIEKATQVATALKAVIRQQGLISNISGKEYPKCEAWTLLGTMLGVFPVLVWTRQVEAGWEARVEARTKDGSVVGAAEAECLRSEKNWSNREDFALRSMAQTRATAKCLRMPLGFVMTLAGYEATPAEEMSFEQSKPVPKPAEHSKPAKTDKVATEATKAWMLKELAPCREMATEFFQKLDWLLPTENIDDLGLQYVPTSKDELSMLQSRLAEFGNGEQAGQPYKPHYSEPQKPETKAETEPWRAFRMPFGKDKDTPLGELPKKTLFGWWANYEVETSYNGKPKSQQQIEQDTEFRKALDCAGAALNFSKKD